MYKMPNNKTSPQIYQLCFCEEKKKLSNPLPLALLPPSSQCLDLVSRLLHSLQIWPLVNSLLQHFLKSRAEQNRTWARFIFSISAISLSNPQVWCGNVCRQIQHEYTTSFILYSLWIGADHKVCTVQADMTRGFSYQSLWVQATHTRL